MGNSLMFIGGLGAVAIGFTGTSLAVLIAVEDRPIISWIRRADVNKYSLLLDYMMAVLHWWFLALILAGLGFVVDLTQFPLDLGRIVVGCLVFLSLGGMVAWYRVSWLIIQLLRANAALSERKLHAEDPPVTRHESAAREVVR